MKKKALFVVISVAICVVNILVQIGAAGLIAFGVYQLNSFLGLEIDTPRWRYGLTGLVYLLCNAPFVIAEVKDTIGKFECLLDWM